jgi:hypothetical protein
MPADPTVLDHASSGQLAPDLTNACDLARRKGGARLVGLQQLEGDLRLVEASSFDLPEDLLVVEVPRHWSGVVVTGGGRCHHLDGDRPAGRAQFAYALDRSARHASVVSSASGTICEAGGPGEGPAGHVVDVAHRLLDLPSPGRAVDPAVLHLVHWLEELLDLATDPDMTGFVDDWWNVVELHPAAAWTEGASPSQLAAAALEQGASVGWDAVLATLVQTGSSFGHLRSDQLARLDGTAFSRFVMASRPTVGELLDALAGRLEPGVRSLVRETVESTGVRAGHPVDLPGHGGADG